MKQKLANNIYIHPRSIQSNNKGYFFKDRIKLLIGGILKKFKLPAFIQDAEINDSLSGYKIKIRTAKLSSIITINGRDFHFDRITGKFSGTGSFIN